MCVENSFGKFYTSLSNLILQTSPAISPLLLAASNELSHASSASSVFRLVNLSRGCLRINAQSWKPFGCLVNATRSWRLSPFRQWEELALTEIVV